MNLDKKKDEEVPVMIVWLSPGLVSLKQLLLLSNIYNEIFNQKNCNFAFTFSFVF